MEAFKVVKGIAAPMVMPNITTDAMSPTAAALSTSTDLGAMLFANWRYATDGTENADFVLNKEPFRQAKILLAGQNFGCGSSRERAVWSLMKFGIRCVIAPSFADIFRDNAFQNGLLPIALPAEAFSRVQKAVEGNSDPEITVDLVECVVRLPDGESVPFNVAAEHRVALMEGHEEIDVILNLEEKINAFQKADARDRPWIHAIG